MRLGEELSYLCPSDFKPLHYRRYVDDTFCIFENNFQAKYFLRYLNYQHPNNSSSQESEDSSSLPFLDVTVTHSDAGFLLIYIAKNRLLGLCTNFDSLSPIQYKINLISVLIYRAYQTCSSIFLFMNKFLVLSVFSSRINLPSSLLIE